VERVRQPGAGRPLNEKKIRRPSPPWRRLWPRKRRPAPYGVYDVTHNQGTVYVGSSGATAPFAVNRAISDTVTGPTGTPQTTTTRYDLDGNVYQVNQPTGATTVDTYDLADQLVTSETDGAPWRARRTRTGASTATTRRAIRSRRI